MSEETVNVRYMVDDVEAAAAFYTTHFGFTLGTSAPWRSVSTGWRPDRKDVASCETKAGTGPRESQIAVQRHMEEEPMIPVRELRFILVTDDYEWAAHLYREVFGLEVLMDLDEQAGRGVILKVPAATLELVDVHHERMVDELEAGRPLDHRARVAVQVDELADAARRSRPAEPRPWPLLWRLPGGSQPEIQDKGRHAAHAVPATVGDDSAGAIAASKSPGGRLTKGRADSWLGYQQNEVRGKQQGITDETAEEGRSEDPSDAGRVQATGAGQRLRNPLRLRIDSAADHCRSVHGCSDQVSRSHAEASTYDLWFPVERWLMSRVSA